MPASRFTDAEFIQEFEQLGTSAMSRKYGVTERGILLRRARVETRINRQLTSPIPNVMATRHNIRHPYRLLFDVPDGVVLVGGDAHYWPGPPSTAHRAFIQFAEELRPKCVVMQGDVIDGATVSRHSPIGWENRPTLAQELEVAAERLAEIERVVPRRVPLVWSLGNHDGRLETKIATHLPELAKVKGVHLKDHFSPRWQPCWGAWINDRVVIKHRFKGGLHAPHNNTLWAGKTMITGHLHSAKVMPITDLNGTRYGVDTGCLADIYADAFADYTEDNPRNWRSGFCVLTFKGGKLLQPELVLVWDEDHVQFRGSIIKV